MNLMERLRAAGRLSDRTLQRNVLTAAISTMVADGAVDRIERKLLRDMLVPSPLFAGVSEGEIEAIQLEVLDAIEARGHQAVIAEASAALSPALRETALLFAMRIAFIDGVADQGEINSLEQKAAAMGISDAIFDGFAKAVIALQRGPSAQKEA
ncbi:MAG: tellurite resistance TerB family protein [Pseudomonadota bacterium]